MTWEIFQSSGLKFLEREALMMEQKGVASSGTYSLYILVGRSAGVGVLFDLRLLILLTTSTFWNVGRNEKEGRWAGRRLVRRAGIV